MTARATAKLNDALELAPLNTAALKEVRASPPAAPRGEVRKTAEKLGFHSRPVVPPGRRQRRPRTGRNVQCNLKLKPETVQKMVKLADANGWGFAETVEYALDAFAEAKGRARPSPIV